MLVFRGVHETKIVPENGWLEDDFKAKVCKKNQVMIPSFYHVRIFNIDVNKNMNDILVDCKLLLKWPKWNVRLGHPYYIEAFARQFFTPPEV